MEAISISETSVNFYETTRRNIPEERLLSFTFNNQYTDSFRAFQNTVLKSIFGSRADEVTKQWRKLNTNDLYNSNSSQEG
jgi:hypothetical protein